MKIAFSNQLETLVLIAGDGDFKDMVEFFTENLYKKVWIFGYRASLSASLHEKASPGCVHFIDDIWDLISVPTIKYSQIDSDVRKPIERLILPPDLSDNCQSSGCYQEECDSNKEERK